MTQKILIIILLLGVGFLVGYHVCRSQYEPMIDMLVVAYDTVDSENIALNDQNIKLQGEITALQTMLGLKQKGWIVTMKPPRKTITVRGKR